MGNAISWVFFFSYLFLVHWVFIAAWALSSCGEWGLLFVAELGLLTVVMPLVAEHRLKARGLQ